MRTETAIAPDLHRLRLEKIGFIVQTHNLLPFLTAAGKAKKWPKQFYRSLRWREKR